jgi:hypothetical protein
VGFISCHLVTAFKSAPFHRNQVIQTFALTEKLSILDIILKDELPRDVREVVNDLWRNLNNIPCEKSSSPEDAVAAVRKSVMMSGKIRNKELEIPILKGELFDQAIKLEKMAIDVSLPAIYIA